MDIDPEILAAYPELEETWKDKGTVELTWLFNTFYRLCLKNIYHCPFARDLRCRVSGLVFILTTQSLLSFSHFLFFHFQ